MPPTLVVLSNLVEILESLRNKVPYPTLYLPEVQRWLKVSDDCCLETRMTDELSLSFHLHPLPLSLCAHPGKDICVLRNKYVVESPLVPRLRERLRKSHSTPG
ncbi:hypothetical protein [Pantoea ananatis]|uniref:hypothetical protein n=1 Tax=Pantoea ananas TaxID=553 RepID=UPI0023502263|nr:hypothetical protein [Pantoea ananatis]